MLSNFLALAYPSFKVKNLKGYFSSSNIIEGFLTAALLSLFIYLSHYDIVSEITLKIINTFNAVLGFYLLLQGDKKTLFWSGFFIGIFWFYWIGFSFRYYEAIYMIPLMVLFVSISYGLIFWIIAVFKHPVIRALLFLGLSYLHPLKFNWLIPELTLIDTFFGIAKWQFALFLFAISLFIILRSWYKLISMVILLLSINFIPPKPLERSSQKIYVSDTAVSQDIKWKESYRDESIQNNLNIIYQAIKKQYDIVILTESAFALFLNMEPILIEKLKTLSKEITIVTGALYSDGVDSYNSTYYFIDGDIQVAHKVMLVPFGEEIPLPRFLNKLINDIFYNGAEDYKTADKPTEIKINGENFRNAICYEATREELYENDPKFMIATSNNAWFTPSIEPTLQKMLLRYLSLKHHTVIYHAANRGGSTVIH